MKNVERFKVKIGDNFQAVFGADSFIENFPEIATTGIEVVKINSYYYVVKNNKIVHDSAFFTEEELEYLEVMK